MYVDPRVLKAIELMEAKAEKIRKAADKYERVGDIPMRDRMTEMATGIEWAKQSLRREVYKRSAVVLHQSGSGGLL